MARCSLHTRFADMVTVPELDEAVLGLKALEQLAQRLLQPA
jgi:hypothetical protein